jgi:hypothetical protein
LRLEVRAVSQGPDRSPPLRPKSPRGQSATEFYKKGGHKKKRAQSPTTMANPKENDSGNDTARSETPPPRPSLLDDVIIEAEKELARAKSHKTSVGNQLALMARGLKYQLCRKEDFWPVWDRVAVLEKKFANLRAARKNKNKVSDSFDVRVVWGLKLPRSSTPGTTDNQ